MMIENFLGMPFLALRDVTGKRDVTCSGKVVIMVAALVQALGKNLAGLLVGQKLSP